MATSASAIQVVHHLQELRELVSKRMPAALGELETSEALNPWASAGVDDNASEHTARHGRPTSIPQLPKVGGPPGTQPHAEAQKKPVAWNQGYKVNPEVITCHNY